MNEHYSSGTLAGAPPEAPKGQRHILGHAWRSATLTSNDTIFMFLFSEEKPAAENDILRTARRYLLEGRYGKLYG